MSTSWKKVAAIGLPALFTLFILAGLFFHARLWDAETPSVQNGVLDLAQRPEERAFELSGQWEFYWGQALTEAQIKSGGHGFSLVSVPDKWNNYRMNGNALPGKGTATYHIHVTGAEADKQYGVRIQRMASAYRLTVDGVLIAQNGSFGDDETAPVSAYRPQLAAFSPTSDNFDLVIQVSNAIYGEGGMWDPIIFGTYPQVAAFDRLLSNAVTSAMSCLVISCLFFLIFFAVQRKEKDTLILFILGFLVFLRLSLVGDAVFMSLFPQAPIVYMNWIDFLTMPWAQFFLLYFIHCTYGRIVPKWQVLTVLAYTAGVTGFILLFPLDLVTASYMLMNYILLLVMLAVTAQLIRAAWYGREGASLLLSATLLILLLIFYEMFLPDRSTGYYLLNAAGFQYLVFVFAQMAVVALRYRRAQMLEIAHLKGQIRPHFIHNALTSIISISRREPDRARELLVDFSSYLRSFYDYEQDELVPLAQELELVQAYTALEQARFGEKLKVEYRVEAEGFLLPSLMLQPLVENAFVHGLREKDEGGTVTVYSRPVKNGKIRIGVRDDGVGIPENPSPSRRGVGIENINRRLARLYHTALIFSVPEGGGCEVYFEIPYQGGSEHERMAD